MLKFSLKMVRTRSMSKSDSVSAENTPPIFASSSPSTEHSHQVFNHLPARELPVEKPMSTIKRRIVNVFRFVGRVCQRIPMVLGVIDGVRALYELYLANIEQPSEKLEVLVLRRSY